ncbi:plastocyanin/azurin family copper-binding protein [Halorarius halobius]|uniref:plastocyanin/azurin family copper-binding protein n=1 Tax=Halorarius halobius TaxID=2962671 RepID=UPI0020CEC99B|nr:plastocyanin/azurin family copper-binding protein [Halorarius halobius]
MDRRAFLRRAAPLAVVGLAGCTDGGGTPTEETPTNTPTPTDAPTDESPTATDTPTATDSPAPTDSATPTAEPTATPDPDQRVVVGPDGDFVFEPESFTVSTGDTVLWTWASAGHNVSPADGGQPSGADWSGKDGTTYGEETVYAHTFETAGTYQYHCDPHQGLGMTGSFTVE